MAKADVMNLLKARKLTPLEFNFESLQILPMWYYITPQDVEALRRIATSPRYNGKIDLKYKLIDDIMKARGFKRFGRGTNRVVYSYLEDSRILAKIAVDNVGMKDNPLEYQNQRYLKPFVAKTFCVSPCGTVALSERVLPLRTKEEFRSIADIVFDIIVYRILGDYVIEDIGTNFFMNWGVRIGFGPVLLDYPYLYKLDGSKLTCAAEDPNGNPCNGEIDYDGGFNYLYCRKCRRRYLASDLRDDSPCNTIVIKGGNRMRIKLSIDGEVVLDTVPQNETINKKDFKPRKKTNEFRVCLTNGDQVTTYDVCNDEITVESQYSTAEPTEEEISKSEIPWKGDAKAEDLPETIDIDESLIEQPDEGGSDDESNIASIEVLNKEETKTEEKKEEEPVVEQLKLDINEGEQDKKIVDNNKKEDIIIKKSSSKPNRDAKGKFAKRTTTDDNINVKSKFIPTEG